MANPVNIPPVQNVSDSEIIEGGGGGSQRNLSPAARKKLTNFASIHSSDSETEDDGLGIVKSVVTETADTQVDSKEQQNAVLERGLDRSDKKNSRYKKFNSIYKAICVNNEAFLDRDLISLLESLKTGQSSLVDLAKHLSPEQRAARKFILLELLLSDESLELGTELTNTLKASQQKLLEQHGDFIQTCLDSFELGRSNGLQGANLNEFVRAFQIIEALNQELGAETTLYHRLKKLKKRLQSEEGLKWLGDQLKQSQIQLEREKTTGQRQNRNRHHALQAKIHHMIQLLKLLRLHREFLGYCQKADMQGLPDPTDLLEYCLQTIVSRDNMAGLNNLVSVAAGVKSERFPAKNQFMSLYNLLVLVHPLIQALYKGPAQRKILVDNLERNLKAGGILSVSGDQA